MAGLGGAAAATAAGAIRAGRAFVELFAKDDGVLKAFDRLKARFQGLGGLAVKIGAGIGAAGTAGVAAFKPAIDAVGELADVGAAGEVLGLTAEQASRLFGVMKAGGSDLRDAIEGLATFNQRVEDAIAGKGEEASQVFERLGVAAKEFDGLRTDERFYKLLDSIKGNVPAISRLIVLMKAVGEDTGKNLKGTLSLTADQMRELGDAFETSSADIDTATRASRSQAVAVALLSKVWREVAVAIAPALKEMADRAAAVAVPVAEFVRQNRQAVAAAFAVVGGLAAAGTAIVGLGVLLAGAGAVWVAFKAAVVGAVAVVAAALGLVKAAVSSLLAPVGLVAVAVAALGYLWVTQTEAGTRAWDAIKAGARSAFGWLKGTFGELKAVAVGAWGGITDAIKAGDWQLAGQVAMTALELGWVTLTNRIKEAWAGISTPIVEEWHRITTGVGRQLSRFLDLVREVTGVAGLLLADVWEPIRGAAVQTFERLRWVFNGIKEHASDLTKFLAPWLGPIVGPFLSLVQIVEDAWNGLEDTLADTLNNLESWTKKTFLSISFEIENAMAKATRAALDAALKVARAGAALDPTGLSAFHAAVRELEKLRAVSPEIVSDAEIKSEIDRIEARRMAIAEELKAEREKAKLAREAARADEEAKAKAKQKELEDKLAELGARAEAARLGSEIGNSVGESLAQALVGARPAAVQAATFAGSSGSFSAADAARRFGGQRGAEKKLGDIALNTAETVQAVTNLARALTFK